MTSSGSISITTNTANGVTFAVSRASFGTGPITLTATGTPIETGTFTYTTNTNPSISFTRPTIVQPSTNGSAIVSGTGYNFGTPSSSVGRLVVDRSTSVSGHATIINANVTQVGTYSITTNTNYGITYSGSGTFNNLGTQNVFLYATGTPTQTIAAASNVFNLNTTPNMPTAITRIINDLPTQASTNGTAIASSYTNGTSAGTMTANVLVSDVTKTIFANQTSSGNGSYFITTNTVNGVIFSSGTRNNIGMGSKMITLTAYGKPIAAGTFTYTTDTTPSVTFTITVDQ